MPLNHSSKFADLTDEQYAALGRIVVEWSNIERLLGFLLNRMLRMPEYLGRTYTSGLSAVRLQQAIAEALEVHRIRYRATQIPESTLRAIEQINAEVTSLRTDRNKVSHFCWLRSNDQEVFGTALAGGVQAPRRLEKTERTVTNAQLKLMHTKAYDIVERLMQLVESVQPVKE